METLQIERSDGVITITMARPEKKNAVNGQMWGELKEVALDLVGSKEDRCVVLTGAGGEFCSGADLWATNEAPEHQLAAMRRINSVIQAFHELPQPTIARVDGVAAGVGVGLALGCDLVLASERSRFSAIFVKRGLSLDGATSWILPRVIGMQKAKELALFGDIISAADALGLGLVNRVLPGDELDEVVGDWSARLASGPPIAMAMTKRLLNRSFEQTFEQALDDEARTQTINIAATKDTIEAISAFAEKRAPVFKGF